MKRILFLMLILASLLSGCARKNKHAYKFIHEVESMNKSCPISVSKDISIDSTRYNEETNKMYYYFTIGGELDNKQVLTEKYDEYKKYLEDAILNSPDMIEYQKFNVTLNYIYISKSTGEELAVFSFPLKYHSNRRQ